MNKTNDQQTIKQRQQEILLLLYRFRFLNRKQIQTLLNHKDHRRIQSWLNELISQKLISQYYDYKLAPLPAVYVLDKAGRKFLKDDKEVKVKVLSRVWREKNYSEMFREHCLFIADVYLSLKDSADKFNSKLTFRTKTDLFGKEHLISPLPDAYFVLENSQGDTKRYFLDVFDNIPSVTARRRVKQYMEYFGAYEWQDNTDKPFPKIVLVCHDKKMKGHLYFYIRKKLSDEPEMNFYLSTKELILSKGLNREALERVEEEE